MLPAEILLYSCLVARMAVRKVELDVAWSTEHGICCSDAQQVVRMKDEGRTLDDELTGAIDTA